MGKAPWIIAMLVGAAGMGYYGSDLFALLATYVAGKAAMSSEIVGRASVIDGDTIEIRGERIRFNGIDAPEATQSCQDLKGNRYQCGMMAADKLVQILKESSPVRCELIERDQYDRFVGNCYRSDGASVQALMVRSGWAMDWPRHSGGAFAKQQQDARLERMGMWAGKFQVPWEWRAEQRAQTQRPAPSVSFVGTGAEPTSKCDIKGNISSSGKRIYHKPGQRDYAKTGISKARGERWFCSEAEARQAGWRPAMR